MEHLDSKSTHQINEEGLWNLFLEGDRAALGEIANRHYNKLYNYGTRFTQDKDFVRDCLQELFMELWERRDKLSKIQYVKPYLLTSLRHKLINESFKLKRFKQYEELPFLSDVTEKPIELSIIELESSWENAMRLKTIISGLTSRQQEIIYLRFYQGLEFVEITQIMNMERQSVANLLHRSLRDIRDKWRAAEFSTPLLLFFLPTTLFIINYLLTNLKKSIIL
ncbi:RNA polymerase sigma factor [Spirosoma endbachense]|uniref:Sigma-70 family RNA polymerase sigma factor n=1 Tax=Spirosoma endbachense TaxID=2666025 RepID=A0A6P1VPJ9_9BACT|nr:sigma-70 family RNA polymerase sigma factor [Spirosoma endbachense]QHV94544.1 sigma-70 family RNA polymerase sigma factor [Spirosoma endbachense]